MTFTTEIYPCITLYQPWAFWIMRGWKIIESRTHNRFACLKNRRILIHAGKKTDKSMLAIKNPYLTYEQICYKPEEVINGHILGSVFVYDFQKLGKEHSKDSLIDCENTERWGLFLRNEIKFTNPIPVKGEMGIWYYDLMKEQKVKKPNPQLNLI